MRLKYSEAFRGLPKAIGTRAYNNWLNLNPEPREVDFEVNDSEPSAYTALVHGFPWDKTPEKGPYWKAIAEAILKGHTLPDNPPIPRA